MRAFFKQVYVLIAEQAHTASEEVFEIGFRPELLSNAEDVGGHAVRVQLYVVARAIPHVAGARQEVVHLVRMVLVQAEFFKLQIHEAGVSVMRAEIHYHQDDIRSIRRLLAVANQLIVVDGMEFEAPVVLQRSVVVSNAIDEPDQLTEGFG